jgi:hypothetical protein
MTENERATVARIRKMLAQDDGLYVKRASGKVLLNESRPSGRTWHVELRDGRVVHAFIADVPLARLADSIVTVRYTEIVSPEPEPDAEPPCGADGARLGGAWCWDRGRVTDRPPQSKNERRALREWKRGRPRR